MNTLFRHRWKEDGLYFDDSMRQIDENDLFSGVISNEVGLRVSETPCEGFSISRTKKYLGIALYLAINCSQHVWDIDLNRLFLDCFAVCNYKLMTLHKPFDKEEKVLASLAHSWYLKAFSSHMQCPPNVTGYL